MRKLFVVALLALACGKDPADPDPIDLNGEYSVVMRFDGESPTAPQPRARIVFTQTDESVTAVLTYVAPYPVSTESYTGTLDGDHLVISANLGVTGTRVIEGDVVDGELVARHRTEIGTPPQSFAPGDFIATRIQ